MLQEFKKFALKGNVIDLAVGVIIGGAFGKIVSSLVNDIIMPIFVAITGQINLSDLKIVISKIVKDGKTTELSINYGQFIQTMIDFLIIAWSIFFIIKVFSKFKRKSEEKPAEVKPSNEEVLLAEIRDTLREINRK